MKSIKFIIITATFSVLFANFGIAQNLVRQSINSSGSSYFQGNILFRQTIGQSANTNLFQSNELILRQGFQQPIKELGLKILNTEIADFSAFPNPVDNELHILIKADTDSYILRVNNILGEKIYETTVLTNKETTINSSEWISGVYLVSIYHNNQML
jgi:hypothetical protein